MVTDLQRLIKMNNSECIIITCTNRRFFPSVYVRCSDEETAKLVQTHLDLIQVTTLSSEVKVIINDAPPTGCAVQTISSKCETHFMIKVCSDWFYAVEC